MPSRTLFAETAGQRLSRSAAFLRCTRLQRAIGPGTGDWDEITVERHAEIKAEYERVGMLLVNAGIDIA